LEQDSSISHVAPLPLPPPPLFPAPLGFFLSSLASSLAFRLPCFELLSLPTDGFCSFLFGLGLFLVFLSSFLSLSFFYFFFMPSFFGLPFAKAGCAAPKGVVECSLLALPSAFFSSPPSLPLGLSPLFPSVKPKKRKRG